MVTIVAAETPEHMQDFRVLAREFVSWAMMTLHPDDAIPPAAAAGLEHELANLPGKYAPPEGGLFIAYSEGEAAGCVAGFESERGDFEMSRFWVRSKHRGQGIGDKLVEALISSASRAGYKRSVLRTNREMTSAHKIYRRAGYDFVDGNVHFSNFEDFDVAMQRDLN